MGHYFTNEVSISSSRMAYLILWPKREKNYSSRDYVTAEILRLRNYTFCLTKKKKLHILKMWNLVTSVVQGPRGAL